LDKSATAKLLDLAVADSALVSVIRKQYAFDLAYDFLVVAKS
jgi:hypothetical protein